MIRQLVANVVRTFACIFLGLQKLLTSFVTVSGQTARIVASVQCKIDTVQNRPCLISTKIAIVAACDYSLLVWHF